MSFYDFFKNIFGIPNGRHDDFNRPRFNDNDDDDEQYGNKFGGARNEDIWRESEDDSDDRMGFNIYSDPLEMHRYFEHQMNEVLKSFGGMFGRDNEGSSSFSFGNMPAVPQLEPPEKNLREQLLKPGYENTRDSRTNSEKPKSDSDVDGKVNLDDLDTLLKDKPGQQQSLVPQFRMFGQSMSSQTVRRPDGTVETRQTRKNNDGTEETTVTKQLGDKRYTVTIRTDKNGRQERVEDMVNLDESEVSKFTGNHWQQPNDDAESDLNKLFPFDKFFK